MVQHIETKEVFVRKTLKTFDVDVYRYMREERFPCTPKVAETVEDGDRLIIIEEYVQGRSLDDVLKERCLTEEEAKKIIVQICEILKPLHDHKPAIIHRDIKPSNIIMQDNQVYLIDFDASRDYDPDETKDTVLMGTRDYAAPEQFGFSQSTPRTDIYALGILMNVMITGKTPSDRQVGGKTGKVIEKCTAIDPDDRYPSVDELKKVLKGKPTSFAPPGFRARRPLFMILAALGYLIIFYLSFTLEVTRSDGAAPGTFEVVCNRCAVFIILMGVTLYWGNYISFLEVFPFKKSKSLPLEIIRIAFGTALMIVVPIIVLAILFS